MGGNQSHIKSNAKKELTDKEIQQNIFDLFVNKDYSQLHPTSNINTLEVNKFRKELEDSVSNIHDEIAHNENIMNIKYLSNIIKDDKVQFGGNNERYKKYDINNTSPMMIINKAKDAFNDKSDNDVLNNILSSESPNSELFNNEDKNLDIMVDMLGGYLDDPKKPFRPAVRTVVNSEEIREVVTGINSNLSSVNIEDNDQQFGGEKKKQNNKNKNNDEFVFETTNTESREEINALFNHKQSSQQEHVNIQAFSSDKLDFSLRHPDIGSARFE